MLLVIGGMDTEGEIFDDTLVYLLQDLGPDEEMEAGEERVKNISGEGDKDVNAQQTGHDGNVDGAGVMKS